MNNNSNNNNNNGGLFFFLRIDPVLVILHIIINTTDKKLVIKVQINFKAALQTSDDEHMLHLTMQNTHMQS